MIRIVVDTAADYSLAELKEKNMELAPLSVTLGDKSYLDTVELERNQFYEYLTSSQDFPKTSQPAPEAFAKLFGDAKDHGDDVICFTISSALSGTYQSANIAKDIVEYDNVYIVDTLTATFGIRLLADYADELRKGGMSAVEIIGKVEALKSRTTIIAALDTLEYLYRGGRLSKTSATIGGLANIKPLITLTEDGAIAVPAKCIGRNKAASAIFKFIQERPIDTDFPVYPIYSYGLDNLDKLKEKAGKEGIVPHNANMQIGSTIGAHIGPGAYGFIYIRK